MLRAEPETSDVDLAFWTGGRDGRLLIQRCDGCERLVHPPLPVCPSCASRSLHPTEVSGRGSIYSFTINRQAWSSDVEVPYVIACVELDEQPGLRLYTNIVDCDPERVEIGQVVAVRFERAGNTWLPLFVPLSSEL